MDYWVFVRFGAELGRAVIGDGASPDWVRLHLEGLRLVQTNKGGASQQILILQQDRDILRARILF